MDLQQLTSLAIVALSAALLVRAVIRRKKRADALGCSHGCCDGVPTAENQVIL